MRPTSKSNGVVAGSPAGEHPAEGVAPRGVSEVGVAAAAAACQDMSFITLQEVFAARHNLGKKQARGASAVFRGVSTTLRGLEFGRDSE